MLWPQAPDNCEDGISAPPFQRASCEMTVGLHMSDLRLDGAAPFQELCQ